MVTHDLDENHNLSDDIGENFNSFTTALLYGCIFSAFILLFVSGVSAQIQVTGVVIDEVDESP